MGVISLGFSTTVHPANSAGPIYCLRESFRCYAFKLLFIELFPTVKLLLPINTTHTHTYPLLSVP